MKATVVLCMLVLLPSVATAQAPSSPNSLYLEFAGNGLIYSANYDRLFSKSFGGRVGVGFFAVEHSSLATIPLMAYYLMGSGSSKLELGLGGCAVLQSERQSLSFGWSLEDEFKGSGVFGTATVGYRYQPAKKGTMFRVGLTPFVGKFVREIAPVDYYGEYREEDSVKFMLSGGISAGYAF